MNNYRIYLISVLLLTFYSCKKDLPPVPEATKTEYPNYSQLKVGNYWVYERVKVDSNGNETFLEMDTCFIEKDTVIGEHTYFKYVRPGSYGELKNSYLRDSMSFIVNQYGSISFSSLVFGEYFYENYDLIDYDIKTKMTDRNLEINVPAGTFVTSSFQTIFDFKPPIYPEDKVMYRNTRYAKDVGIVFETVAIFSSTDIIIERRLSEYHIEE